MKGNKRDAGKQEARKKPSNLIKSAFSFNFSRTTWAILLVIAGFFIFVLYIMTKPIPPPITTTYAGALVPVTGLRIEPGEKYAYELYDERLGKVRLNNTIGERTTDCIVVETDSNGMSVPFCLDERTGEPKLQQGASGPSADQQAGVVPQFIHPWMLALTDNWTWSNGINTTIEWMGSTEVIESSSTYRVVARGGMKGRPAFKVLIEASARRISNGREYQNENGTQVVWVDAEKRVLLYAGFPSGHIELVEAPFKIEPYSESK